ncbi:phage antirepressor KilAC domain-containing protein [Rothia nasimurium]|uniref:phage antirepressor KilAC domain-containing protein n=1 Tax=Rothia nasimurium TaxID=85336 RepID=UPI001F001CE7|nr:phage antirepressor KilAC domain-containing protein [Rothia nasimurium]
MNQEIQHFNFNGLQLRAILIDGEPWFVATDVATFLGYRMASDMARSLQPTQKGTHSMRTPGGHQELSIINEPGLYSAIMRSRKAEALPFQNWVTTDVLPAIRRTGSYNATPQLPQSYSEALRELASTVEAKERLELENAQMKPIVQEYDEFMGARGTFTAEQAAKLLCRAGVETGQNRLLKFMDSIGWTSKRGFGAHRAVQRYVEQGLIDVQATKYRHPKTGELMVGDPKVVITPKGLHKLRDRMLPPIEDFAQLEN